MGLLGVRALTLQQDLRRDDTLLLPRLLDEALSLPALRLVERLTVKLVLFGGPLAAHAEVVDLLARRAPPSLRELVLETLGDPWGEALEEPPIALAPLSSLARLTSLHVLGREVALDGLTLPEARTLRIEGALSPSALAAVAASRWPALESLQLGYDADAEAPPLAAVAALLDGKRAPLVETIARAPQLGRLDELYLDRVDEPTVDALLAQRAAFAHLQRLGAIGSDRRPVRLKGICRHVDCLEHRLERDVDERFVEIDIVEPQVRIREGRIGHPGRLRIVDGGWSRYHAEIAARRLDGYRTVAGSRYGGRDDPTRSAGARSPTAPTTPRPTSPMRTGFGCGGRRAPN